MTLVALSDTFIDYFFSSLIPFWFYVCIGVGSRATHAGSLTFYTLHASSVHVAVAHTHRQPTSARYDGFSLLFIYYYILFFLSFMWCHERIKKISHCSGPIHKYINTYEIFIFFCAPQIRIFPSSLSLSSSSCFSRIAIAFTQFTIRQAAIKIQKKQKTKGRKKNWNQQGNVLRHFAFPNE